MKASVIIPAYNEEDTIGTTLDSLKGQDAEVIVVVDGDDSTEEIAREHEAVDKVISGNSSGAGEARNRGVEASDGDIVIFTDADSVVPERWVESHLDQYSEGVIGVGGPATSIEEDLKNRVLYKLLADYMYRVLWPLGFPTQPGFNCSFRKDIFEEEGGFNEEMPFMEDSELSLRMKDYGKIVYATETEVETSARREEEKGYLKVALKYINAYKDYYILDKRLEGTYFDNIEK